MQKLALVALILLMLTGCVTDSGADERLETLEAEVNALKAEIASRDESLQEELAQIQKNLDVIRDILEMDKERAEALEKPGQDAPSDEELDAKVKTFVGESLERLTDLTRKLLDKMQKELDAEEPTETPTPPEGDQI